MFMAMKEIWEYLSLTNMMSFVVGLVDALVHGSGCRGWCGAMSMSVINCLAIEAEIVVRVAGKYQLVHLIGCVVKPRRAWGGISRSACA